MAAPKTEPLEQKQENFNGNCKSITSCSSIARIVKYLKEYQTTEPDDIMKTFNKNNYPFLTDDFNHILVKHLGDNKTIEASQKEFELIHSHIMNNIKQCELEKCNKFARNNRDRQQQNILLQDSNKKNNIDKEVEYYIDTMDTMHCFFLHTYDIGYRINKKDETEMKLPNNNDDSTDDNESYHDIEMEKVCSILKSKRQRLQNIRGIDRCKNTKFVSNVTEKNEEKKDDIDKKNKGESTFKLWGKIKNKIGKKMNEEKLTVQTEIGTGSYSFGHKYDYWDIQNDNYVNAKYDHLLDEMTNNKIYRIHLDVFNSIQNIAKNRINSRYARKIRANDTEYVETGIGVGDPITLKHLMAILFYTNLDSLSSNFSTTFRSLNKADTIEDCKERNSEFAMWSKLLIEAVNIYGTDISKSYVNVYYHGINKLLVCPSLVTEFNAPTSTTPQLSVAALFAKQTGAIMELGRLDTGLRFFNCTWLSCFANEDERLFCCPPLSDYYQLRFTNIRCIADKMDYRVFINAITTLEHMVTNTVGDLGKFDAQRLVKIIRTLANKSDNNYPDYINQIFQLFVNSKKEIGLYRTQWDYIVMMENKHLKSLFFDDSGMIKIKDICIIFKNCEIILHGGNTIGAQFTMSDAHFAKLLSTLEYSENYGRLRMIECKNVKYNISNTLEEYQSKLSKINWILKNESDIYQQNLMTISKRAS